MQLTSTPERCGTGIGARVGLIRAERVAGPGAAGHRGPAGAQDSRCTPLCATMFFCELGLMAEEMGLFGFHGGACRHRPHVRLALCRSPIYTPAANAGAMPMRSMIAKAVLGLALSTMSACYGYRHIETAPQPGTRVRIMLLSATELATVAADSTRQLHPGVLETSGTVQAAAADTIAIRLGELRTSAGVIPNLTDRIALVPTALIARIEERHFQAVTTALGGIGLATLALAGFLVIIIVTITKGF